MIGAAQRGAPVGPVANALRSGARCSPRTCSRVGPPALAAAAADCGLVSSGVVPLCALDRPVGVLQLLGTPGPAVEPAISTGSHRWPRVLAAQLANVAALVRAMPPAPGRPVPAPRAPLPSADTAPRTERLLTVARPAPASRHPFTDRSRDDHTGL